MNEADERGLGATEVRGADVGERLTGARERERAVQAEARRAADPGRESLNKILIN